MLRPEHASAMHAVADDQYARQYARQYVDPHILHAYTHARTRPYRRARTHRNTGMPGFKQTRTRGHVDTGGSSTALPRFRGGGAQLLPRRACGCVTAGHAGAVILHGGRAQLLRHGKRALFLLAQKLARITLFIRLKGVAGRPPVDLAQLRRPLPCNRQSNRPPARHSHRRSGYAPILGCHTLAIVPADYSKHLAVRWILAGRCTGRLNQKAQRLWRTGRGNTP